MRVRELGAKQKRQMEMTEITPYVFLIPQSIYSTRKLTVSIRPFFLNSPVSSFPQNSENLIFCKVAVLRGISMTFEKL